MMLNPGSFYIPWELIFALAIIGLLVGVAWIIRIARRTDDESSAHWRYRKTDAGRRARFGGPRRRMTRAHTLIRVELALAIAAPIVGGFLFLAAPRFGSGMREPWLLGQLFPCAGLGGMILGLIWMVRLSRANPEAGERTWRYRDF